MQLSDFAERIMRKNKNNETDLPLTISSKDGLVDQISFFNKTVASKDMSGYYLLMNGEYAYNKSYSVGYDFGSIKRLERYPMGALSTLYICFVLKKYNSDFIKTYFDSLKWYKEIYMISAEGARNHGLLNVPTDEFFDTYHYITENEVEQEKIAKLMDLIERRIQKQQALVDSLKKYKRGVYKRIFSINHLQCQWTSLGEICEVITKGTTPHTFRECGTIKYIKIESIIGGSIVNEKCKWIDQDTHEGELRRSILKAGDILYSIAGSLGVSTLVQLENLPANTNQALAIIRTDSKVNRDYVLSVLRSSLMEEYILASRTTGAQPNLSLQQMRDFKLPLPREEKQIEIASIVTTLEKRIALESALLDKMILHKSALMQQLFV